MTGLSITVNVWTVAFAALGTAIATGLGAVPFLFIKNINQEWLGIADALAAGLMLGASHGLIGEGLAYNPAWLLIGAVVGAGFIFISHFYFEGREDLQVGELQGGGAVKAVMLIGVMTAHSFSEGVGVGVSFGGDQALGLLITIAIALHNIPEGLAISLAMVPRGTPVWRAMLWSIFSSLPQPLMAIPAYLFVTFFKPVLPFGLGFAAGAMIWMVFSELIPDALEEAAHHNVALSTTFALLAMIALQQLL